ncbi:hypothetical protein LZ30DRAFT_275011 [Colletotrichum cereale]|nr:hypothetical protein LZ30DRAFT_275011 [Colletotrichum cereale]
MPFCLLPRQVWLATGSPGTDNAGDVEQESISLKKERGCRSSDRGLESGLAHLCGEGKALHTGWPDSLGGPRMLYRSRAALASLRLSDTGKCGTNNYWIAAEGAGGQRERERENGRSRAAFTSTGPGSVLETTGMLFCVTRPGPAPLEVNEKF